MPELLFQLIESFEVVLESCPTLLVDIFCLPRVDLHQFVPAISMRPFDQIQLLFTDVTVLEEGSQVHPQQGETCCF